MVTQLPEPALKRLRALYAAIKQAEATYGAALDVAVAAVGLNPDDHFSFNLDTGEITPAVQEEAP